jgi:hypothetical protein
MNVADVTEFGGCMSEEGIVPVLFCHPGIYHSLTTSLSNLHHLKLWFKVVCNIHEKI